MGRDKHLSVTFLQTHTDVFSFCLPLQRDFFLYKRSKQAPNKRPRKREIWRRRIKELQLAGSLDSSKDVEAQCSCGFRHDVRPRFAQPPCACSFYSARFQVHLTIDTTHIPYSASLAVKKPAAFISNMPFKQMKDNKSGR